MDTLGTLLKMLLQRRHRLARRRRRPRRAVHRSERLERLRSGKLSLNEFLGMHVEDAIAPIKGLIHESDVELVRAVLRERLGSDPAFARLIGWITGKPSDPA